MDEIVYSGKQRREDDGGLSIPDPQLPEEDIAMVVEAIPSFSKPPNRFRIDTQPVPQQAHEEPAFEPMEEEEQEEQEEESVVSRVRYNREMHEEFRSRKLDQALEEHTRGKTSRLGLASTPQPR